MEEYKDLIDLALKLNDKEWFNHLTKQAKEYEKVQNQDNIHNDINKPNIVLEEFNNESIALQTEEGLRTPINTEDLEKYVLVKIKSKRNNVLKIYKGEEVNIEQLSTEESYFFKVYYYGFLQGFCSCYSSVEDKNKTIEKLESEIQQQKEFHNVLHDITKGISTQNSELIKLLNSKNKINLWDRIKAVFKKNGIKSI